MGISRKKKGEPFDKKEKFSILGITNFNYCNYHLSIDENLIFIRTDWNFLLNAFLSYHHIWVFIFFTKSLYWFFAKNKTSENFSDSHCICHHYWSFIPYHWQSYPNDFKANHGFCE